MNTEIIKKRGKYCVQITQGVQSFVIEGGSGDMEDAAWMQVRFDQAIMNHNKEILNQK
jgi:hypothetical protein